MPEALYYENAFGNGELSAYLSSIMWERRSQGSCVYLEVAPCQLQSRKTPSTGYQSEVIMANFKFPCCRPLCSKPSNLVTQRMPQPTVKSYVGLYVGR